MTKRKVKPTNEVPVTQATEPAPAGELTLGGQTTYAPEVVTGAVIRAEGPQGNTRLGWHTIDEKHVYVTGQYPYTLPLTPTTAEIATGMDASLRLLEVGEPRVITPLWAALYRAPLETVFPCPLVVWVYGNRDAVIKHALTTMLSHFGTFTETTLPAAWSASASALLNVIGKTQDMPLWIEDYTEQFTYKPTVNAILRAMCETPAASLIISNGNRLPAGPQAQERVLRVPVQTGIFEETALAQTRADATLYPAAMSGYVQWIAANWPRLSYVLRTRMTVYERVIARTRQAWYAAQLWLGFECALEYANTLGIMTEERFEKLYQLGSDVLGIDVDLAALTATEFC